MNPSALDPDSVNRLRNAVVGIGRSIDRQVSNGTLTSTQLSVLAQIAKRGPLGLSEIAATERINPTMLSRVIGKLESERLIRRETAPDDKRAVQVVATRKGIQLRELVLAARSQLLIDRLEGLSPEVAASVIEAIPVLEALHEALRPRP